MRTTHTCAKCHGRRIWHIEKVTHDNTYAFGAPLRVAYDRAVGPTRKGPLGGERRKITSLGHFDAYICARCGFTEWYAQELSELTENSADGVHLIGEE